MAERGKAAMDKGRKRRRLVPEGPSLLSEEEVADAPPLARRTRSTGPTVSVVAAGEMPEVPLAVPLRLVTGEASGETPEVEVMDADTGVPEDVPRNTIPRDPTISPNYFRPPPVLGPSSGESPLNPETGVEFLCKHGKDLLRSGEMSGYGKMSNSDRIRHGQANMLQVMLLRWLNTLSVYKVVISVV